MNAGDSIRVVSSAYTRTHKIVGLRGKILSDFGDLTYLVSIPGNTPDWDLMDIEIEPISSLEQLAEAAE